MTLTPPVLGLIALPLLGSAGDLQMSGPSVHTSVECAVTRPNGIAAGEEQQDPNSYGSREVSVGPFGLWPDGTVFLQAGGRGVRHSRRFARNEVWMAARRFGPAQD